MCDASATCVCATTASMPPVAATALLGGELCDVSYTFIKIH